MERLQEMGFVDAYGSVSLQEDVAMFAEAVFTGGEEFRALAAKYPRLRKKAQLLVGFYRQTMPGIELPDFEAP